MGHGGTLDPPATGVMVIGFGDACKNFDFFLKGDKVVDDISFLAY